MNYMEQLAVDIRAEVPDRMLPDENESTLMLLYSLLASVVGEDLSSEHVHDAWTVWMTLHGQGDHPSAVPYEQLSKATQDEDLPFVAAIRRAAAPLPAPDEAS